MYIVTVCLKGQILQTTRTFDSIDMNAKNTTDAVIRRMFKENSIDTPYLDLSALWY